MKEEKKAKEKELIEWFKENLEDEQRITLKDFLIWSAGIIKVAKKEEKEMIIRIIDYRINSINNNYAREMKRMFKKEMNLLKRYICGELKPYPNCHLSKTKRK